MKRAFIFLRAMLAALCLMGFMSGLAHAQVLIKDVRLSYGIGARPGIVYGTFINQTNRLIHIVAVTSPAFARIELHTHLRDGDIMRMRKIERIALPPSQAVKLQAGGLHLMGFDPQTHDRTAETTLTFIFDNAPAQMVGVRPTPLAAHKGNDMGHHGK